MSRAPKLRVAFVAGLDPVAGGGAGGQLTEASTLFHSGLRDAVELLPLSSTMASVPPPPLLSRAARAVGRVARFAALLRRCDVAFVYAGDGFSLLEKGIMCVLARLAGRGVVVRFGSGGLPAQCAARPWYERWLRFVLANAHVVSTQGPRWSAFFGRYAEAEGKIVETGNGLSFPPEPGPGPARERIIAFAGWMQKEKGIFEALQVFERVRGSHPGVRCVFAGGGRDLEAFRARVRAAGLEDAVETPGWVPREHVRALFERSEVLLFPSHYEGLPNAVLEAMGAGLPPVVTRVGSIQDVVDDGETGVLVDVGDVDAMTRAVDALLSDRERAADIGRRARSVVRSRFDVEAIWPTYQLAFERAAVAAGRRRAVQEPAAAADPREAPRDRSP